MSILIVVDLPAPLGPMYPTISPASMPNVRSCTATTSSRERRNRPVLRRTTNVPLEVADLDECHQLPVDE